MFLLIFVVGCSNNNVGKTDISSTDKLENIAYENVESDFNDLTDIYVQTIKARDIGDFKTLKTLREELQEKVTEAFENLYKYDKNQTFEDISIYYQLMVEYGMYIEKLDGDDYISKRIIDQMVLISNTYNNGKQPSSFIDFYNENEEKSKVEKEKEEQSKRKEKEKQEKEAKEKEIKEKEEEEKRKQEEITQYETGITFENLARNPETYNHKKVKFYGKIVQVVKGDIYSQFRFAIDDDYDKMVLLEIPEKQLSNNRLLKDDTITIKGVSTGEQTYKSTIGGEITIPSISVDSFELE